jgi:hypothetical protein
MADAPEGNAPAAGGSSRSTVSYSPSSGSRTIFGLMAFAVTFALVGTEIESFQKAPTATKNPVSDGVKIILGGFIGSAVLIMVSKAGEPGRKAAVGTAVVVVITSVVVKGKPVWDLVNKLFGSKPTTPLGGNAGGTSGTPATAATGGSLSTTGTTGTPTSLQTLPTS